MSILYSRVSAINGLHHGEPLEAILADLHRSGPESVTAGRNVIAGYTRGWGLEFGVLATAISEDPIYRESMELARERTLLPGHRLMNIFMIMKYGMNGISGDFFEFGSYRGGSAIFIANVARRLGLPGMVYALDTFAGMPSTHDMLDIHFAGNFSDTSFDDLVAYLEKIGLDNIVPIKGLFEDTTPEILRKTQSIALAHIDCDIHSAVKYAISATQPYMHPAGGYVVFDDPLVSSCIGAMQAVEDMIEDKSLRAEQAYPHLVYRFPKLPG